MNRARLKPAFQKNLLSFYIHFLLVFLSVAFYMFKLCFFVAQIFKLQTLRKVINESIFYMSSKFFFFLKNIFYIRALFARPLSSFILSIKMISYFYIFYKVFM